jgi:acyl-CoA synthetase (AMP-forming)/AMP-acid ligase II
MSLIGSFRESVARSPGKTAIICGNRTLTFAEVDRASTTIAANLLASGVRAGDRVALHFLNVPEFALAYLGCFKAGAIAVPINYRLKAPEIQYILRHSAPVCYAGGAALYREASAAREEFAAIRNCFITGDDSQSCGLNTFADLLTAPDSPVALPEVPPDQPAVILYTSGTTARPKGVTHSHRTLAETARIMTAFELDDRQVVLIITPMAHVMGSSMLLFGSLSSGSTVVLLPQADPDTVLDAFERHRCTYVAAMPAFFHAFIQAQRAAPRDLSSGRYYFCGGDAVSPALQAEFLRVIGTEIREGYGSTEMVPLTVNPPGAARAGSFGKVCEGIEIRLVDGEDRDVVEGETGEVCARGGNCFTGYWEDPKATALTMRNGWLHMGDLARRDADGYYWFAGRSKQIIIRGGSNISPQEVEAVFLEHPHVSEIAVIGRADAVLGETVAAYVVPRKGHELSQNDLIAFAQPCIAAYKLPEQIIFVDSLPKTATGKLDRRALREADQQQRADSRGSP